MFNLVAIGDPIIDTHVQIADNSNECRITPGIPGELCLNYGSKIPIIDSFQDLGGNAPNVAVGAQRLGLKSAVVATLGRDATGGIAIEQLKKRGVDTRYISFDDTAKTRYSIVLNYRSERTILSFSDQKNYLWPEQFPTTDWIYYTGLSAGFETIQTNLVKYLSTNPDTRLAVNPGSYVLKFALDWLHEIVAQTDLLLVNLEEAEAIASTTLIKEKSITALVRRVLALGPKEVVLTDGANGAWAATIDEIWHHATYPVDTVAKTGAGDAFSAAYLTARFLGHDLPHALAWGTANSTSVIQYPGPHRGLLDQTEIEEMITRYADIKSTRL